MPLVASSAVLPKISAVGVSGRNSLDETLTLAAAWKSAADAALGAYLRCLADGIVAAMGVAS
jgi:hypothetical protein